MNGDLLNGPKCCDLGNSLSSGMTMRVYIYLLRNQFSSVVIKKLTAVLQL